jgi:quercetin dioxygenase-like cupin family protein
MLPADDLGRNVLLASADEDARAHVGIVGDTYTVLLSANDTAGRYCLIDMHIPPGGGPPPHRHNFEESFLVVDGQIDATFRGKSMSVTTGQTIHIPANAPHQFRNNSDKSARLLCICSPGGQEEFFALVGVPVATRTTAPPVLDAAAEKEFRDKAGALAAKYVTELLPPA